MKRKPTPEFRHVHVYDSLPSKNEKKSVYNSMARKSQTELHTVGVNLESPTKTKVKKNRDNADLNVDIHPEIAPSVVVDLDESLPVFGGNSSSLATD